MLSRNSFCSDHDAITYDFIQIYCPMECIKCFVDQSNNARMRLTWIARNERVPRVLYALYSGMSVKEAFCWYRCANQSKCYQCVHAAQGTSLGYGGFMRLLIHDKMVNDLLGLGAWLFRCLYQLSYTVYLSDFHQLQTSESVRVILFFANPTVKMRNGPIMERRHVADRGWFCRSKWGPISAKTWTVYTQEMVQISPNLFQ